ncbi:MAG: nucleoside recognition domain-containing protein [Monoglobales bacterium]
MIIFSCILSIFTGKAEEVAVAASEGAATAVTTCLEIVGIMMLWNGLMNIASESGLVSIFSKAVRPVYRRCFNKIPENSVAGKNILMNIAANVLGLGNAATPFGIKAMEELGKSAGGRATNEMVTFLVLNTASIQLLPATVISLRGEAGSAAPSEIIFPVWIVSVFALIMGLLGSVIFRRE